MNTDDTNKLDAQKWRVMPTSIKAAKDLVRQYHYMKTLNTGAVYIHGLFQIGDTYPSGVAVWLPAMKGSVDRWSHGNYSGALMLHRLVVRPDVPSNGASFLLGRSIRLIKKDGRFSFLITYADTFRNHTGGIYKATNWDYRGTVKGERMYEMADGSIRTSGKSGSGLKSQKEFLEKDAKDLGYFDKHVFTMVLEKKEKAVSSQLSMF